jgi:hypothetical protein
MEKDKKFGLIEINTMGNGTLALGMDMGCLHTAMETNIKDSMLMINNMGKEKKFGLMEINTMDNGNLTIDMEKVNIFGEMGTDILVNI